MKIWDADARWVLMLTQIIMSLADATQPAFSTMVMMIKCCNCAQLHSYFQLIVSMPCSRKYLLFSRFWATQSVRRPPSSSGWWSVGQNWAIFFTIWINFGSHTPVRYPLSAPGYPLSSCHRKFAKPTKGLVLHIKVFFSFNALVCRIRIGLFQILGLFLFGTCGWACLCTCDVFEHDQALSV